MNILSASNPAFANAANTLINLTIDTDKFGVITFTASPNDTAAHGRDLFARAMAGEFGPVAAFVPSVPSQAKINADADAAIYKWFKDNIPVIMDALEAASTGSSKAAIKAINDLIKSEKAKKA